MAFGGKLQAYPYGIFTAEFGGTFHVQAEAGGQRAEVVVNVIEAPAAKIITDELQAEIVEMRRVSSSDNLSVITDEPKNKSTATNTKAQQLPATSITNSNGGAATNLLEDGSGDEDGWNNNNRSSLAEMPAFQTEPVFSMQQKHLILQKCFLYR